MVGKAKEGWAQSPKHATRTPARDKVRAFIPMALASKWSASKLAKEAGVSRGVATSELKAASMQTEQELQVSLSDQTNRSLQVAHRLRTSHIARAERIDALSEQILADLESRVKDRAEYVGNEAGRPPALNGKELETLIKLQEKHWIHTKDMAGITVAEKIAIGQAKGEAQGSAIVTTLIDATAIEIGKQVWLDDDDDVQEAEIIGD